MINLPKGTAEIIQLLLSQNKKIEAVKLVHTLSKCGLKEALDFVENFKPGQITSSEVTSAPAKAARDIDEEILSYLAQGKKLQAVKIYKNFAHAGLAQSKDYVEKLAETGVSAVPSLIPPSPTNSRDTQIDDILTRQGLKQHSQGSAKQSLSPLKRFFIILFLAIGIAFILAYLMFRIKMK